MVMKRLSSWDFRDEFKRFDRDYFSIDGYNALYDIINGIYPEGYVLDVIGIVSTYREATETDIMNDYSHTLDSIDELEYMTFVIELENGNYLYEVF